MDPAALDVDLDLPRRHIRLSVRLRLAPGTLAVVGPSGSGKSSLLRAVAGLERPAGGRIALGDEVWFDARARVDLPPERRGVGMVFQDYALFPHMSVLENVAFAGRRDAPGLLERLGIAHLAGARPAGLSGGERQRVAIARALARRPRVLLLDEPMAALDAHTRAGVREELGRLLAGLGLPALLVSHDFDDAAALAGRVLVLVDGRVVQEGSPGDLVSRPADPFVASLTGANLLRGVARPGPDGLTLVALEAGGEVLSTDPGQGPVGVVVQPSEVTLARGPVDDSAVNRLPGPVLAVQRLGNRTRVTVGPVRADITSRSADQMGIREGEPAVAVFKATATRLVPLPGATRPA
ncbi:MAG: ABC transporter ATP-binding protein [Thermoleophilia bacterium]|jgi:molybdate transport system ATP-binding protein|nr:ABC transporter ATP-binding protein [Thermoleophilia bacterium]